jgi:hypothetical protein
LGKLPGFYKLHVTQFQEWVLSIDPFKLKYFMVTGWHQSPVGKCQYRCYLLSAVILSHLVYQIHIIQISLWILLT